MQQTAGAEQAQPAQPQPAGTPPPGWYIDPMGGGGERYWDGIAWSEHFTRSGPPAPQPAPQQMQPQAMPMGQPNANIGAYAGAPPGWGTPNFDPAMYQPVIVERKKEGEGLVVAGWVCAILFPLIGLIIGCVIAARPDSRGKWVIIASIGMMILSWYILSMLGDTVAATSPGATAPTGAPPPIQ